MNSDDRQVISLGSHQTSLAPAHQAPDPSSSGRLEDRVTWNSGRFSAESGQSYHLAERILQSSPGNPRQYSTVGQSPFFVVTPTVKSLHILNKTPSVANPRLKNISTILLEMGWCKTPICGSTSPPNHGDLFFGSWGFN